LRPLTAAEATESVSVVLAWEWMDASSIARCSYCTLSACLPPIKGFIVELLDALIVAMDADDALMVVRISMRLSIGSVSPPQTMVVNITIASVVEM